MDDIVWQARQGSVAAIIQVLNDKLAQTGVRTRAILSNGILQLLCEAPEVDNLDQSQVVEQVRQILESISPRHIRRVKINTRITQEKQLLWIDEIKGDPEGQILWSKEIVLHQPNIFSRLITEWEAKKVRGKKLPLLKLNSSYQERDQIQFRKGIISGILLSLGLVLIGWGLYRWLNAPVAVITEKPRSPVGKTSAPLPKPSPVPSVHPFVRAVRLAQEAVGDGEKAQSREDWQLVAQKWQEAANLMESVSPDYPRYAIAVDRFPIYRRNGEIAQQKADNFQY